MNNLNHLKKLKPLLKKPFFKASDARNLGIGPSLINYYIKIGLIQRIDRGLYRSADQDLEIDFRYEDLILISQSIKEGVICLISALTIYEMTDEIARTHWIAVSNDTRAPKRKGTKIIRMRNITLGKTKINIGNMSINIFNPERTIIDSFRYLGVEIGIKALKVALKKSGKDKLDLKKLQAYAKTMRVKIAPYLMAVTT